MKVLNLYSGIGGNRKLLNGVDVTAVEINPEIAKVYQDFFPSDNVVVDDAHKYLLKHYNEYDFVWSSPPCPTHSRARFWALGNKHTKPVYRDIKLYEEIIFLDKFFKGKWVVENVKGYYKPLIEPIEIGRHYFWSNFHISNIDVISFVNSKQSEKGFIERTGFDLTDKKFSQRKDQIYRNIINSKLGKHIFDCAFKRKQTKLVS